MDDTRRVARALPGSCSSTACRSASSSTGSRRSWSRRRRAGRVARRSASSSGARPATATSTRARHHRHPRPPARPPATSSPSCPTPTTSGRCSILRILGYVVDQRTGVPASRPPTAPPPIARAATCAGSPTDGWPCASRPSARRTRPRTSRTSTDTATSTPTTCGSTCRRCDELLDRHDGILPLPTIVNHKTLDPRDPDSPAVVQLETAMGAAISVFAGAERRDAGVRGSRFSPVKNTDDLLAVRSDAYRLSPRRSGHSGRVPARRLRWSHWTGGSITLIDDFEERFPSGRPSLLGLRLPDRRRRRHLRTGGRLRGDVRIIAAGGPASRLPTARRLEGRGQAVSGRASWTREFGNCEEPLPSREVIQVFLDSALRQSPHPARRFEFQFERVNRQGRHAAATNPALDV